MREDVVALIAGTVLAVGALAFVLYIPTKTLTSTVTDLTFAFELAMCAMALNLCMGYCGIISLASGDIFASWRASASCWRFARDSGRNSSSMIWL